MENKKSNIKDSESNRKYKTINIEDVHAIDVNTLLHLLYILPDKNKKILEEMIYFSGNRIVEKLV